MSDDRFRDKPDILAFQKALSTPTTCVVRGWVPETATIPLTRIVGRLAQGRRSIMASGSFESSVGAGRTRRPWSWLFVVREDLVEAELSLQGRVIDDQQE